MPRNTRQLAGRSVRTASKIDQALLRKTRIAGEGRLQAIVYTHKDKCTMCRQHLENMEVKIRYELPLINAYAVEIPGGKLNDIARSDAIHYIADDMRIRSTMDIASRVVEADKAQAQGYTGKDVGIAILDTGVYPHPDLTRPRNRLIAFKDFVNDKGSPYDDNGHGTFVAGIAAGNGYASQGKYKGIAPQANIIGVKVMDARGDGSTSDIVAGMQWVVDNAAKYNIKVMSLSLGATPSASSQRDALSSAVDGVWRRGILVVAAAGNDGPKLNTINTPGINPRIITVGASDDKRTVSVRDDGVADFSSRGPGPGRINKPDLVAPGVKIKSLNTDTSYNADGRPKQPEPLYATMSGTSMATPMVSGLGALLWEKDARSSPDAIKESLTRNTVSLRKKPSAQGQGLVRAGKLFSSP